MVLVYQLIYKYFHHEPFDQKTIWKFKSKGPLSDSNSALPWIVFYRDLKLFRKKYPDFKIVNKEAHTPFRYILSGGFSYPQLIPNFLYIFIDTLEKLILPINKYIGLFYTIAIIKKK